MIAGIFSNGRRVRQLSVGLLGLIVVSSLPSRALAYLPTDTVIDANSSATDSLAEGRSVVLPTRFDDGHVFVRVETSSGDTVEFYTDSGGAMLVTLEGAKRLGLTLTDLPPEMVKEFPPDARSCSVPVFSKASGIPNLPAGVKMFAVSRLFPAPGYPNHGDGILGQAWFAGHIWTWDFPGHQLILRPEGWHPGEGHEVHIGFKSDANGARNNNFPSIDIRVDGQTLPMLLDTGAMTMPTSAALTKIADGKPSFRSTSFIARSVFERWHANHPDWPVIEDAETGSHMRMIQVDQVEIAGLQSGPVWFTERQDASFHDYMSSMMDRRVEGSIGNNAFERFEMTIDYPGGRGWFDIKHP
jgi:predicted aspartyl protease